MQQKQIGAYSIDHQSMVLISDDAADNDINNLEQTDNHLLSEEALEKFQKDIPRQGRN